jgi:hypothetical protein
MVGARFRIKLQHLGATMVEILLVMLLSELLLKLAALILHYY